MKVIVSFIALGICLCLSLAAPTLATDTDDWQKTKSYSLQKGSYLKGRNKAAKGHRNKPWVRSKRLRENGNGRVWGNTAIGSLSLETETESKPVRGIVAGRVIEWQLRGPGGEFIDSGEFP